MNTPVKTDEIKQPSVIFNYVAFLLLALGIGLFYGLEMNIWLKWGIFILSLAAALGTFFFIAPMGINLHGYVRDSYREMQKVVCQLVKKLCNLHGLYFYL